MDKFSDRHTAGKALANALHPYMNSQDTLVLALPRGGVPVAYEIAKSLKLPLDILIVRKLGVPGHAELAMGAIAFGGQPIFNEDILNDLQITQDDIAVVIAKEREELLRRERVYRGDRPFPMVRDKTIILVDDGMATGATMRAAIETLRTMKVDKIIVAVPVADKQLCENIQRLADEMICPLRPTHFYAVGAWYESFPQTEDEEVHALLKEAKTFI